jgi:hypothetical protein
MGGEAARWGGTVFGPLVNDANRLGHTLIENAEEGIYVYGDLGQTLSDCTIRGCTTGVKYAFDCTKWLWETLWNSFLKAGNVVLECDRPYLNRVLNPDD